MSEEKTLELTRRRALGGLLTIGVGSAAVGAGTLAAFSDTETSSGNQVTAGTLDLSNPSNGKFEETELAPGTQTALHTITTTYDGSIDATVDLDISLSEPADESNDSLDDESDTDAGADATAEEFASQLIVDTAEAEAADGSTTDLTSYDTLSGSINADQLNDQTFENVFGTVTDSDTISVNLQFTFDEDAGNYYQGDGVVFDLTFTANQA